MGIAIPKFNYVSWEVPDSIFDDWSSAEIDVFHSIFALSCGRFNVLHSTLRIAWPSVECCGVDSVGPRWSSDDNVIVSPGGRGDDGRGFV